MSAVTKGKSPFYPGQPVPAEFFVGRASQLERIIERGAEQVAQGKPAAFFVQGEYGIGKSSIAGYVQQAAELKCGLYPIYSSLGGAKDLSDVATAVLAATMDSGACDPRGVQKVREMLAKYVGKQELYGISLNFEALRQDAPGLSNAFAMLQFLRSVYGRLSGVGTRGLVLTLDEINGISSNPDFAHFIKGLVDQNALSKEPVPLLLVLCGVEERRREMIAQHQPVDRIFDVVEIEAMTPEETAEFYGKAFGSVGMSVEPMAMEALVQYAAGFPKIMHLLGDAAFWADSDGVIDTKDAAFALVTAAEDVGRKYVDQQVYKALRSEDYHSILRKIGQMSPGEMTFTKAAVEKGLSQNRAQETQQLPPAHEEAQRPSRR